jgi:hypothetical protein
LLAKKHSAHRGSANIALRYPRSDTTTQFLIADGDSRGADSQFAERVRFRASAGKQNGAPEFDVRIVVNMIVRLLAEKSSLKMAVQSPPTNTSSWP